MSALGFVAVLFLLLFAVFIVLAGAFQERAWRKRRARRYGQALSPQTDAFPLFPECWLVVKSRHLETVQAALSLHNPKPCSWMEGLTNVDRLFIAPPIKGWVLVTGIGLPDPSEDVDACFRFVLDLSRKLGLVLMFSANRGSHQHAWIKAEDGQVVRAYAWAGKTLWCQGPATRAERELDLKFYDYADGSSGLSLGEPDGVAANVEKVPLLAARWGFDPSRIQQHLWLEEHGVAGKPAHRY